MLPAPLRALLLGLLLVSGLSALCGCGREPGVTGRAPDELKDVVSEYVAAVARGDGSRASLELSDANADFLRTFSATSVSLPVGADVAGIEVTAWDARGPGGSAAHAALTFAERWATNWGEGTLFVDLTLRITLADGVVHEGKVSLRPENATSFTRDDPAGPSSDWRVAPAAPADATSTER